MQRKLWSKAAKITIQNRNQTNNMHKVKHERKQWKWKENISVSS